MIDQNSAGEALPFSVPKQEALLGHLLCDEKFFLLARNRIKPEWWTNGRLKQVWTMALNWNTKYNRAPKSSEVAECPEMCAQDNAEQAKLRSVINLCIHNRENYGIDALSSELTDWLHARIYMVAFKKSESIFNQAMRTMETSKYKEAYEILKTMNREIDDTSFEPGQAEEMDDPESIINKARVDAESAISFGLPTFDRLLLPEGQGKGSLLKGDMTVLLAPTNVGKTTAMVTVAAYNIWAGKDVLLVTHEGRISDIKMKIWQSMLGTSKQEMMSGLAKLEFQERLAVARDYLKRHLEFMPLNKAGMTVEDVETIIRRRCERWKAAHQGKGFDLIIDDYAAKLTTVQARGGHFQLRQIHEVVYNYFSQIALEHDLHVITAIQTNREGSKINNRKGGASRSESRLLMMEDVMEAWGPMTTATNVISINRDPESQARNVVTWVICKSRSSEVGWAVIAKSNFAAAQSHIGLVPDGNHTLKEAPCTFYRGTSSMGDKVDAMLSGFSGKEIPWEEIRKSENGAQA